MGSSKGANSSIQSRAAALAIDISIYVLLALLLDMAGEWRPLPQDPFVRWGVFAAFTLFYWIGLDAIWTTPGKWFVGLKMVDHAGEPPSFEQWLKRSLFPGVVWVWLFLTMPEIESVQAIRSDGTDPALVYLFLSPFVWIVTVRNRTTYSDRLSNTLVIRRQGYVWVLKWLDSAVRSGMGAARDAIFLVVREAWEAVVRTARAVWAVVAPFGIDARRAGAFGIDLILLWIAYAALKDTRGPFAQSGSWYFVFLAFAALVLWYLPSRGISPGKAFLDLRIVDARGEHPGKRAALMRTLVPGTIWIGLLLIAPQRDVLPAANWTETLLWSAAAISIFLAAADAISYLSEPYYRSLHDLMAGTYVIRFDRVADPAGFSESLPPHVRWQWTATSREPETHSDQRRDSEIGPAFPERRVVGFVIDCALAVVLLEIASAMLSGYEHLDSRLFVRGAILVGYFVGLVALGSTPGSWLAGVRLVSRSTGKAPGFRRAAVRMLPYAPVLILPVFNSTRVAYHYEANELVMMARDLVWLALAIVICVDLLALYPRGEAMHNQISNTTVERCALPCRRAALGTWIGEKVRWFFSDEPEMTPAARVRDR